MAVSAGLSQPSSTRLLADRLADATRERLAAEQDRTVDVRVIELRDLAVDIANHLVSGFPSATLREAIDAVTEADGLIAVTPVFTASYSGLFKSFFDLIDNTALTGKPVVIAATGGTARHSLVWSTRCGRSSPTCGPSPYRRPSTPPPRTGAPPVTSTPRACRPGSGAPAASWPRRSWAARSPGPPGRRAWTTGRTRSSPSSSSSRTCGWTEPTGPPAGPA